MTTVSYLGENGAEVVDGLRQVSALTVEAAGPEVATDPPSADCVVTTPDAVCDGQPLTRALRAAGYDGPVVLFGAGSHETLAAATARHGAETYVRQRVDGESQPWNRLAEAVERVTTDARRIPPGDPALSADRVAALLRAEDDVAASSIVVGAVSEVTGGDVALVDVAASADKGIDVHVVAATERFDPSYLDAFDGASADDAGTEVTVDGQGESQTVVVVPVDEQRSLVVTGQNGSPVGDVRKLARLTAAAFDRTRRVRSLHHERDRLASLFENTSDAIAEVEYVDGEPRVHSVNPAFERLFGVAREEIIGANLDDHVVPDDENASADAYRERALSGERYEEEVTRLTADGPREFLLRSVPLDREGSTRGYAIYTDITGRKRTEQVLGRLHEVTRDLIRAETQEAIAAATIEAAGDILEYPVTAVRFYDTATGDLRLAATSEETTDVLGERPTAGPEVSLAWEAFHSGTAVVVDDLAAHGVTDVGITCAMYLPLGDKGLLTLGSPTADRFEETEQRLAKVLAANVEVALTRAERERADREREQELARQNERLDAFASVVSHDLRNPLSVARGYLGLAEEACLDANERDPTPHFARVDRAHERMNRLITDLLALAREGETVGVTTPVSIEASARRAWVAVDTGAATLDVVGDRRLQADPERLDTLFENLFRNSVEHGSTGPHSQAREDNVEHGSTSNRPEAGDGVEHGLSERPDGIEVRVGILDDGGFYIEDNGPGIPVTERETVFERGYTTAETGTGFGLSIVQSIATAHGWTISVTEGHDGGARFEVRGVET